MIITREVTIVKIQYLCLVPKWTSSTFPRQISVICSKSCVNYGKVQMMFGLCYFLQYQCKSLLCVDVNFLF